MVDVLYNCAKFRYECGNYSEAAEYLYFYRVLVSHRSRGVRGVVVIALGTCRLRPITRM